MFRKVEEEVVICSPMEGQITMNGKPLANAKIERFLKWKDEIGEKDYFFTDEEGFFKLPMRKDIVTLSIISTFVMSHEIRVFSNNEEYLIWTMGKGSTVKFGELGGRPVNFKCELTDDLVRVEVEDGLLGTSCKWDSIEKINGE